MVTRRALLLLVVLTIIAVGTVAAVAYFSSARLAVELDPGASAESKVVAERVLFLGIIATILAAGAGLAVIVRAVRITSLLDKLIVMNRISGFSAERALRGLGDVGDKIATVFRQVAELSEKKSRKISALTGLNELLLNVSDQLVLVVDVKGNVLQASKPLLERLDRARSDIVGVYLDDLLPGANIKAAIQEASQTRSAVVRERDRDSLVFNPVVNRDGQVTYLVAVVTKSVSDDIKAVAVVARAQPEAVGRRGFIRRLLGRR
jgi:PAS domain-containing protein